MLAIDASARRGDFRLEARFTAPAGAAVALFGASGCGKTTLLNIVAGLQDADSARIECAGEVLCDSAHGIALPAERRRIGYVFQDARLFPHLDVRANLLYGFRRQHAATPRIGFDEVVELLGVAPLLARRPHTLSGGERQRVALGRALLAQPRLLLLDEPLAALDAARREEVLPYIERLRDHWRLPMLYVTHQFEELLRVATHVALMEDGRIVASGCVADIALHPALRRISGEALVGAVFDATVASRDASSGLCAIPLGNGTLRAAANGLEAGQRVRIQVLARDVIVATRKPEGLSVRNVLAGVVSGVEAESPQRDLVRIDIGGAEIVARVTREATQELALREGQPVWALIKAVSLRGHGI